MVEPKECPVTDGFPIPFHFFGSWIFLSYMTKLPYSPAGIMTFKRFPGAFVCSWCFLHDSYLGLKMETPGSKITIMHMERRCSNFAFATFQRER